MLDLGFPPAPCPMFNVFLGAGARAGHFPYFFSCVQGSVLTALSENLQTIFRDPRKKLEISRCLGLLTSFLRGAALSRTELHSFRNKLYQWRRPPEPAISIIRHRGASVALACLLPVSIARGTKPHPIR